MIATTTPTTPATTESPATTTQQEQQQQDDVELEWISMNDDCWARCEYKGGACQACSNDYPDAVAAYCCSGENHWLGEGIYENGDCPNEAVAVEMSTIHSCVIAKEKVPPTPATTSAAPATTSSASATTSAAPVTTAQGIRSLSVWAWDAVNTFVINGERIGASGGGEKFDIALQQNEIILSMDYGINRWSVPNEWVDAICNLKIITNLQEYGPYHPARVMKPNRHLHEWPDYRSVIDPEFQTDFFINRLHIVAIISISLQS